MAARTNSSESVEELRRQARERLYPRLTNPNYLILRKRRQLFQRWLERMSSQNLTVLDVGGSIQPYRPLIQNGAMRYIAVDLIATALVDVVANAEQLPFPKNWFDLAFCTQMLEYAPLPGQVISEIHRALKPGGILLLSVPSLSLRDADEDCWRFWPAGIRQLLSGFSQVEVVPEGGSIAGFFRTVNAGLNILAKFSFVRAVLGWTVIPVLNLAGLGLENLVRSHNDQFAVNYSVMARKGSPTLASPAT
jgi:SAM-dependent methyltransferase